MKSSLKAFGLGVLGFLIMILPSIVFWAGHKYIFKSLNLLLALWIDFIGIFLLGIVQLVSFAFYLHYMYDLFHPKEGS